MDTLKTNNAQATFRAATADDLPAMSALIASENLPPFFIEEFLDGFIVSERGGEMLACGGVEIYGDCAVIRSIVVAPQGRGVGMGRRAAELLIEHARERGANDFYLFTMDARPFWQHLGFADVSLEGWAGPPRACWQYQYISQNRDDELFKGMHSMRKRV
jgi:amino-acid N-acetyltransferase